MSSHCEYPVGDRGYRKNPFGDPDENVRKGVRNRSKLYPEGEELPLFVEKTLRNSVYSELNMTFEEDKSEVKILVNRVINPFGNGSHVILPRYLRGQRVKSITIVNDLKHVPDEPSEGDDD